MREFNPKLTPFGSATEQIESLQHSLYPGFIPALAKIWQTLYSPAYDDNEYFPSRLAQGVR